MIGYPFDSVVTFDEQGNPSYDRAISSVPLKRLIGKLFTTGVMPNPSDNLQVFEGEAGMTVIVHAGFCVIEGGLKLEEANRTLEVQAADASYDRIDTVVMRWNNNEDARICDLYILKGTASSNPVRPTLTRTASVYEIGLADIFVPRNVTSITQERITDTRLDSERCGIVSSISEFDTTTLYEQVQSDLADFKSEEQAEFLAWFATIQNILDENVAAHLQNEIDALANTISHLGDVREFDVKSYFWGANPDSGTNTDYPYLCEIGVVPQNETFSTYPIRQNASNFPQSVIDKVFEVAEDNDVILTNYHYLLAIYYHSDTDYYHANVFICASDAKISAYTGRSESPFSNTSMPLMIPSINGLFRDWQCTMDFNNNEFTWRELTPSGGAAAAWGFAGVAGIDANLTLVSNQNLFLDHQGQTISGANPTTDYPMGMLCVLADEVEPVPSGIYSDDAMPTWDLGGAGTLPTATERESIDMILEGIFNSQGVKLYATDKPTADLTLRTKGD